MYVCAYLLSCGYLGMHVFQWTVILQRNVFSDTTGRIYAQMGSTGSCTLKTALGKWESPIGETSQASCLVVAYLNMYRFV